LRFSDNKNYDCHNYCPAIKPIKTFIPRPKLLASDAAMVRDTDRHAWASHFLQDMSKAIIDDVAKVLDAPGNNRNQ